MSGRGIALVLLRWVRSTVSKRGGELPARIISTKKPLRGKSSPRVEPLHPLRLRARRESEKAGEETGILRTAPATVTPRNIATYDRGLDSHWDRPQAGQLQPEVTSTCTATRSTVPMTG